MLSRRTLGALALGCLCGADAFMGLNAPVLCRPQPISSARARPVVHLVAQGVTMQRAGAKGVGRRRQPSTQKGPVGNQPVVARREPEGPLSDDPALPMIEEIIKAIDERKGLEIWAARVAHLTYTTSFIVNCQGSSRPQLQAIAANVCSPALYLPCAAQPAQSA
jgi:hypothetical protein